MDVGLGLARNRADWSMTMRNKAILLAVAAVMATGCNLDDVRECKDGETRCVAGDTVNYCIDGNWWGYTQCNLQKCEVVNGVAACVPVCRPGDTKCDGSVLLECTENSIWPDRASGFTCSGQDSCISVQSFAFCANPANSTEVVTILKQHDLGCNNGLQLCGDNNTLYSCAGDELSEVQKCGAQVCGVVADGSLACVNACENGTTKCEGNNLVTCSGNVYGAPVPCAEGTVCTLDKHDVYACVERKKSYQLCAVDKCIGNTLYRCADGIYDNGTDCGAKTCAVNRKGAYVCMEVYGECTPGCSADGSMMIGCEPDGSVRQTICPNGCDGATGECRPCADYCDDSGADALFYRCDGDSLLIEKKCPYGCNASHDGCLEGECGDGAVEYGEECDGTLFRNGWTSCADWLDGYDDYSKAVTCTSECKVDRTACTCQAYCKNSGTLAECESEFSYKDTTCPYGCEDNACRKGEDDFDNDGYSNEVDACPFNRLFFETADKDKCDTLLQNGIFYIYRPEDITKLKALLADSDTAAQIQIISLERDINLAMPADTIEDYDGCKVNEAYTGISLHQSGTYDRDGEHVWPEFRGYEHRIYAENHGRRCVAQDALFHELQGASVENLKLDLDVRNAHGILANEAVNTTAYIMHVSNIEVSGKLVFEGFGTGVGAVVGEVDKGGTSTLNLHNLRVDGVTVIADTADDVGGMIGHAHYFDEISVSGETNRVHEVRGRSHVGGMFGRLSNEYTQTSAVDEGTIDVKVGSVKGTGDGIGGYIGWNESLRSTNVHIETETIQGGALSNDVGGFIGHNGYATFGEFASNDVKTGRILGSQNVGGYIGYHQTGDYGYNRVQTGEITGSRYVAGYVGYDKRGHLTDIIVHTDKITGKEYVAGLVNNLDYAPTIQKIEVSTGALIGETYVGGLVGDIRSAIALDSMYNVSVRTDYLEGSSYVGGIFGKYWGGGGDMNLHNVSVLANIKTKGTYYGGLYCPGQEDTTVVKLSLDNVFSAVSIRNDYMLSHSSLVSPVAPNGTGNTAGHEYYFYNGGDATFALFGDATGYPEYFNAIDKDGISATQKAALAASTVHSDDEMNPNYYECDTCEWKEGTFDIATDEKGSKVTLPTLYLHITDVTKPGEE